MIPVKLTGTLYVSNCLFRGFGLFSTDNDIYYGFTHNLNTDKLKWYRIARSDKYVPINGGTISNMWTINGSRITSNNVSFGNGTGLLLIHEDGKPFIATVNGGKTTFQVEKDGTCTAGQFYGNINGYLQGSVAYNDWMYIRHYEGTPTSEGSGFFQQIFPTDGTNPYIRVGIDGIGSVMVEKAKYASTSGVSKWADTAPYSGISGRPIFSLSGSTLSINF